MKLAVKAFVVSPEFVGFDGEGSLASITPANLKIQVVVRAICASDDGVFIFAVEPHVVCGFLTREACERLLACRDEFHRKVWNLYGPGFLFLGVKEMALRHIIFFVC